MGYFICFEGLDGSGKSTQIDRLVNRLSWLRRSYLVVRCPGGTPAGEKIRELVLSDMDMSDEAELFLHIAARAELFQRMIQPALAGNQIVITSRFTDSTVAYQGRGRGFDIPTIYGLNALVQGEVRPDLTVFLDIPVEHSLRRIRDRGEQRDKMEKESPKFYRDVRSEFLKIAKATPDRYLVIDGLGHVDLIEKEIWNRVERVIEGLTLN